MNLITQRDLIRRVADHWAEQYPANRRHEHISTGLFYERKKSTRTFGDVLADLNKLDKETATVADVEKIIGNSSWTRLHCHECSKEVKTVVQLGEPADYESATALICPACLKEALRLAYTK